MFPSYDRFSWLERVNMAMLLKEDVKYKMKFQCASNIMTVTSPQVSMIETGSIYSKVPHRLLVKIYVGHGCESHI